MNDSQKILSIIIENVKKSNVTEKECLLACGINTSFLTDWKNNKVKSPSYDKLIKIAQFLNLDLYELFLGENKNSPSELSEEEQELLQIFNSVSEREKGELIGYAKRMLETSSPESREEVS